MASPRPAQTPACADPSLWGNPHKKNDPRRGQDEPQAGSNIMGILLHKTGINGIIINNDNVLFDYCDLCYSSSSIDACDMPTNTISLYNNSEVWYNINQDIGGFEFDILNPVRLWVRPGASFPDFAPRRWRS